MAAELMDMVQWFRQKPRESVPAWLLWLWDMETESVIVNGPENWHPLLLTLPLGFTVAYKGCPYTQQSNIMRKIIH